MNGLGANIALRSLMAGTLLAAGAGCYGTFLVGHQQEDQDASPDPVDARADATVEVDAEPPYPHFSDVDCWPPIEYGFAVEEDEGLYCEFTLEGPAGSPVILGCQDDEGAPLDCSPGGWPPREIEPQGAQTLPLEGSFYMEPWGLAGERVTVVWTATSGPHLTQLFVEFDVVSNQPLVPPSIFIDCGGDTDWQVGVMAGAALTCEVEIFHPNPLTPVGWSVFWQDHPAPINEPQPQAGTGTGTFTWTWQTDPAEAGQQVLFAFRAGTQGSPPVGENLIVDVF